MALFEQQLRVIDTHTYENLDEDGEPLVLKELQLDNSLEYLYEDVVSEQPADKVELFSMSSPLTDSEKTLIQESLEITSPVDSSVLGHKKPRRNSQILQQLCREESVKRLISGWNKNNVTKTDDELVSEAPVILPVEKSSQKTAELSLETLPQKTKRTDVAPCSGGSIQQDGMKSEKLVGKATVIRRPSIARLKALFEKSHGNDAYASNSDSRRRRPLGRSHTLHAPRGCSSPSSDDSDTRKMAERALRMARETQHLDNKKNNAAVEPGESQTVSFSTQEVSGHGEDTKSESCPFRVRRKASDCQRSEKTGSWGNDNLVQIASPHVAVSTGVVPQLLSVARSQSSDVVQPSIAKPILFRDAAVYMPPPELPVKKKSVRKTSSTLVGEELGVKATVMENIYDTPKNVRLPEMPPQLPEKKHIGKLAASKLGLWIANESSAKSNLSKLKKNDLEIHKDVVENVAKCQHPSVDSSNIHVTARSLIDRYTNVNLTTKKNIEQIENSIKQHPRGAIIDLTSRTSFVENNMRQVDPHMCNNNVQGNPEGSCPSYESLWVRKSGDGSKEGPAGESRKQSISMEASESDLNKNLLLHSPPPRTRRPHLGRSVSKTKTSESTENVPNISADQEINKAVKDLNTIGYLLDALASQTLDDLKKENSILDDSSNIITKITSKPSTESTVRPELPVKQKSVNKHLDFGALGDHGMSSSFPPSPQKNQELFSFDGYSSVCTSVIPREHRQFNSREVQDLSGKQVPPDSRTLFPPEYEAIYPLQKSASAPHSTIMFSDATPGHFRHSVMVAQNGSAGVYSRDEDMVKQIESNVAPPKPPRTFAHVSQHNVGFGRFDGGRLLVSVASPKHVKIDNAKKSDDAATRDKSSVFVYPDRASVSHNSIIYCGTEMQQSPPPYKNAPNPHYNTPAHEFEQQPAGVSRIHRSRHPKPARVPDPDLPHSPVMERQHSTAPVAHWNQERTVPQYSTTPEYGKIPVVPVYTTVRPDFDRHHVQWDSSVETQQQFKGAKNYEAIYDLPRDCQSRTLQGNNPLRHSQSDVSVYAVLREMKQVEEMPQQQSPLYSQVVKPRKYADQRHRRSQDDIDIRPVAPPRNKKHYTVKQYGESSSPDDGGNI